MATQAEPCRYFPRFDPADPTKSRNLLQEARRVLWLLDPEIDDMLAAQLVKISNSFNRSDVDVLVVIDTSGNPPGAALDWWNRRVALSGPSVRVIEGGNTNTVPIQDIYRTDTTTHLLPTEGPADHNAFAELLSTARQEICRFLSNGGPALIMCTKPPVELLHISPSRKGYHGLAIYGGFNLNSLADEERTEDNMQKLFSNYDVLYFDNRLDYTSYSIVGISNSPEAFWYALPKTTSNAIRNWCLHMHKNITDFLVNAMSADDYDKLREINFNPEDPAVKKHPVIQKKCVTRENIVVNSHMQFVNADTLLVGCLLDYRADMYVGGTMRTLTAECTARTDGTDTGVRWLSTPDCLEYTDRVTTGMMTRFIAVGTE